MSTAAWIGILFCITQSAMFSGLNLAFFSVTRLRLEVESKGKNKQAQKILKMREDSNFLLTTILWGNVGINVLLTLLSNSVMAGLTAFIFSTFIITFLGEIIPQAYFSRHAIKMASLLAPLLRFYQFLLYPVAKPTALILDRWLGAEAIHFFEEKDLRHLLKLHVDAPHTDLDRVEGKGALNFLAIDDLPITEEGEDVDPRSIVQINFTNRRPVFPTIGHTEADPFLQQIHASGKKWIILTDDSGQPQLTLDADGFLRAAFFEQATFHPLHYCHRPIIITDPQTRLGEIMTHLKVYPEKKDDDVIDQDIVLLWGEQKRIITGSDVLGRLLRGIATHESGLS